jgi:hypothetical protein
MHESSIYNVNLVLKASIKCTCVCGIRVLRKGDGSHPLRGDSNSMFRGLICAIVRFYKPNAQCPDHYSFNHTTTLAIDKV